MKGPVITAALLLGALGAAGGAAYFANHYIDKNLAAKQAALESQYTPVRVVVASDDLSPGAILTGKTVSVREVPRAFLSSEAIPADRWNEASGRVLARPLKSGEPVLLSHLALGLSAGFSAQLAQGMRAVTFPVNEESAISGLLAPGDRIDIFFTTMSGQDSTTLPLLYNVPVLATGLRTMINAAYTSARDQNSRYSAVTVLLNPEDAAKLTQAQESGKITVTLRRPEDQGQLRLAKITKKTLLFGDAPAVRGTPHRPVEIILGGI
jgi:pilus assembly protein CpaB